MRWPRQTVGTFRRIRKIRADMQILPLVGQRQRLVRFVGFHEHASILEPARPASILREINRIAQNQVVRRDDFRFEASFHAADSGACRHALALETLFPSLDCRRFSTGVAGVARPKRRPSI